MIFQVAGPHFGDPAAQIWQKGVLQPVRLEFHTLAFHFLAAGALIGDPAAQISPKGVPQPVRLDFHDLAFHFLAAEPLFVLPAFRILQKGAPQPDIKRAAVWFFSVPLPHIEALPLSALSVPVCLSACQGCFLLADPLPERLFGISFAEHTLHTRLA